ncbi:hypothetical protein Y032_0018g3681, partial [Ancylostoma ceylanicum]
YSDSIEYCLETPRTPIFFHWTKKKRKISEQNPGGFRLVNVSNKSIIDPLETLTVYSTPTASNTV